MQHGADYIIALAGFYNNCAVGAGVAVPELNRGGIRKASFPDGGGNITQQLSEGLNSL